MDSDDGIDASRRRRFEHLFRTHYPAVRRYAYHRAITGSSADDLVSETFVVAWRRLDAVPHDDPLPWLLAVATNVQRNQARSRRRYLALIGRVPRPEPVPPPVEPSSNAPAIKAALAALSPDDREILILVAWDGLTPHEAADVIGTNAGTARLRLHRARKRFAARLAESDLAPKRSTHPGQFPGDDDSTELSVHTRRELSHEQAFRF